MIKLESDPDRDLHHTVDPHLIQPLPSAQPTFDDLLIERDSETNSSIVQDDRETPQDTQIPSCMEACINLDLYLTPLNDAMSNYYTDELNTPDILEATKELNKIINTTTHQKQPDGNPFDFPTATTKQTLVNDIDYYDDDDDEEIHDNPVMLNNFGIIFNQTQQNSHNQHSNQEINGAMVEHNFGEEGGNLLSPATFSRFDEFDINMEEYDLLLDADDAIVNDANNYVVNNYQDIDCDSHANADNDNQEAQATTSAGVVAQEAHAINDIHNYALKRELTLNIGAQANFFEDEANIQTPEIINTICSIENDFKFVQARFISADQIKQELAGSPPSPMQEVADLDEESLSLHSLLSNAPSTSSSYALPLKGKGKRARRKKSYGSDDDEDYVPPSVASSGNKRRHDSDDDEDDDEDDYVPAKIPKRGRPAKSVSARTSDSSEGNKYREMRDKNNEASRRSRRKRRVQEQHVEEESEELSTKNARLKAQVAELEKAVSSYRSNLMTILLNKN